MSRLTARLQKLTPVEILVLYGLIFAACMAFYMFYLSPQLGNIRMLEQQASTAELRASLQEAEVTALNVVASQISQMEQFITELKAHFGGQPAKERIVENMRVMAEQTGVTIANIQFDEVLPFEELIEEDGSTTENEFLENLRRLPVMVRANGDWENIHRFLYSLERVASHVHFQEMTILPQEHGYQLDTTFHLVYMEGGN